MLIRGNMQLCKQVHQLKVRMGEVLEIEEKKSQSLKKVNRLVKCNIITGLI